MTEEASGVIDGRGKIGRIALAVAGGGLGFRHNQHLRSVCMLVISQRGQFQVVFVCSGSVGGGAVGGFLLGCIVSAMTIGLWVLVTVWREGLGWWQFQQETSRCDIVGVLGQFVQVQLWALVAIAYLSTLTLWLDVEAVVVFAGGVLEMGCVDSAGAVFKRLHGGGLSQVGSTMIVLLAVVAGVMALVKSELKRGGAGARVLSSTFVGATGKWNSLSI